MIRLNKFLIYFGIILTPIFGIIEFLFLMGNFGQVGFTAKFITSPLIKAMKDFVLIFICLVYFCSFSLRPKMIKIPNILILLFFIFLIINVFLGICYNGFNFTLLSIRIFLPMLLIVISYNLIGFDDMKVIKRVLVYLALFEMVLGVLQILMGRAFYGPSFFGIFSRVSGTFFTPNSLAIFLLVVNSFLLADGLKTVKDKIIFLLLSIGILFTSSGIGIIGLFLGLFIFTLQSMKANINVKVVLFQLFLVIFCTIIISLPLVTGRGEKIGKSAMDRFYIFTNYFFSQNGIKLLFGNGVGVGSNTSEMLKWLGDRGVVPLDQDILREKAFISDSLYTSLLAQVGLMGLMFFLFFTYIVYRKAIVVGYTLGTIFFPVLLVASMASITIELFPVNWIYAIVAGHALRYPKQYRA